MISSMDHEKQQFSSEYKLMAISIYTWEITVLFQGWPIIFITPYDSSNTTLHMYQISKKSIQPFIFNNIILHIAYKWRLTVLFQWWPTIFITPYDSSNTTLHMYQISKKSIQPFIFNNIILHIHIYVVNNGTFSMVTYYF